MSDPLSRRRWALLSCYSSVIAMTLFTAFPSSSYSQTISTGAITGITVDPTGAAVPDVSIQLTKADGSEPRSTNTDEQGRFGFLLLDPGEYHLRAEKINFEPINLSILHVYVTEANRLELHLHVATHFENVEVASDSVMVQSDSSALGQVLNRNGITGLPLVTRNFTQIASLAPGVSVGVYHAGELGIGGTAQSQIGKSNDGIYVHGSRSYDNNWQLDGVALTTCWAPVRPAEAFRFRTLTLLRNSKYKPDCTTPPSDAQLERMSVSSQKPAATVTMPVFSSSCATTS